MSRIYMYILLHDSITSMDGFAASIPKESYGYRHSLNYAVVRFRKIRRNSEVCANRNRVYIWPATSVYTTDHLVSKLLHSGIRSPAAWPPHRMCYGPVALFRHPRLTALTFQKGKIRRAFQRCYFNSLLFIVWRLKLRYTCDELGDQKSGVL